jgi:hypothetical protein
MIKNFNQYNESILDKMEPKSEKEIEKAYEELLNDLKSRIDDESMVSDFFFYLEGIYEDRKKLINDLIDEGLDASDLLVTLVDDLDLDDNPSKSKEKYKKDIKQWMYNLIEKNKEDIDLENII